ncbi:MAG TPA: hypothetical protein DCR46_03580 [Cytophagales bacterium]|nr:hypothetical protein [Cytophagales bacterium]
MFNTKKPRHCRGFLFLIGSISLKEKTTSQPEFAATSNTRIVDLFNMWINLPLFRLEKFISSQNINLIFATFYI